MWLKAPIIEKGKDGRKRNTGGGRSNRHGTPQGGVISPLLSNLYLHILDKTWDEERLQQRLGACLVRYADDFLVLCREGTTLPLEIIKRVLNQLDLRLNREKTRIVNSAEESFTFLGFEIRMKKSRRTGNIYPHVQPSRESLAKIRKRIRWLTRRERTCLQLPEIVDEVNSVLRGWVNYFHYGHCSRKLQNIRSHTEERLRNHLCKRHRIVYRSVGYKRFPNRILYERYGLYKVPATAGWTRAHALR